MSIAAIVLADELDLLQKMLRTTDLDLVQWLICVVAGLTVLIPAELRKASLRRRSATEAVRRAAADRADGAAPSEPDTPMVTTGRPA